MRILKFFLGTFLLLAALRPVCAESKSGAATMQRFTSVRAAGMGEAFSTVSGDGSAWQFNPAMLGTLSRPQGSVSMTRGFAADYLSAFSFGYPTHYGNILTAINYYDTGSETLYASDGAEIDVHLQQDFLGTLSYGKRLGIVSFGTNLKYLSSRLAEYRSACTYAFDVGGAIVLDKPGLIFGLSLRNIGRGLKFVSDRDPLPQELRAGASYATRIGDNKSKLLFSADVPYSLVDKKTEASLGIEWSVNDGFFLRAGEHFNSDIQSFTFGFGVKTKAMIFDYSFGAAGPLDDVHGLSIGYRWGKPPPVPQKAASQSATENPPAKIQALLLQLNSKDWQKRKSAAEELGAIREDSGVKPLIAALNDENETVAATAAKSLGLMPNKDAVKPLGDALNDSSVAVKIAAANSLKQLGDKRAIAPLKKALRDEDVDVRKAVSEALKALSE